VTVADCRFDAILAGDAPAWFVLDEPEVAAFLDVRPLFKGHVLVLPRTHYETLADLPQGLIEPLFGWVQRISAAMPAAYGAQGSFVAVNNTVSQSVPHLHVHVVPRTKGDGLRGFFWPRGRYASDDEAAQYARRMRDALAGSAGRGQAGGDGDSRGRAEYVAGDPAQAAAGEPGQPG
jgi:histidine triad (HIT) family protein